MRHPISEYRQQRPRGGLPSPRLASMLLMLAVVGMLIYRAKDPAVWKWLAPGGDSPPAARREVPTQSPVAQAAPPPAAKPKAAPGNPPDAVRGRSDKPQPVPEASLKPQPGPESPPQSPPSPEGPTKPEVGGPTDEDPDEMDEMIHNDALVIDDGTLHTTKTDQYAYSRLLMWVKNQSLARLRERVPKDNKDVRYDRFTADPNEMRLQIVEIPLDVRQVEDYGVEGPGGGELYEIQGFNREGMLFFGVVEGLPEGWPSGAQVQQQVRLVGYFFKLQGYYPASGKTRGGPLQAPVIVGKLAWQPSLVAARDDTSGWVWGAMAVGAVVIVGMGIMLKGVLVGKLFRRPARVRLPSLGPDPDAPAIDDWLDMAQSEGTDQGNNISGNGESKSGHAHPDPEADDGHPPLFPGGFDSIGS
ncbi:MAG: hypothetical protein ABSG86_16410 [Thermoguttaceae bacterium]